MVADLIIDRSEWMWMGGQWSQKGNNYKRYVTRNDAGNITKIEIATLFQGIYDPIRRLNISYGPDGKAARISESSLTYDGVNYAWVTEVEYVVSEWESTDGQIIGTEDLFTGANRIKKAQIIDPEITFDLAVEYDATGGYKATMTVADSPEEMTGTVVYTPLENGGFSRVSRTEYGEGFEQESETDTYDSWGILTGAKVEWTDGFMTEIYQNLVGTVEYDKDHGYPVTYTVTEDLFDEETEEYVTTNMFRAEYSDYIDASSGISSVIADDASAPVEYFNLQGISVANPSAGIYLRRQGSTVSKVMIR